MPYETEPADRIYFRQTGMRNSVVSCLLTLGDLGQRLEAASAAGEHVERLGLDPV